MYTKQNLEDSLKNEVRIIKHLFTKIPEGTLDYRPTPGQRSTLELLQYLGMIGGAVIEHILTDNMSVYGPAKQAGDMITAENFVAAMDTEEAKMVELLAKFTEEDLKKEISLFGGPTQTKGVALIEAPLKMMAAYRLQLFLYAKQAGNPDIGTSNAWAGMDAPAK